MSLSLSSSATVCNSSLHFPSIISEALSQNGLPFGVAAQDYLIKLIKEDIILYAYIYIFQNEEKRGRRTKILVLRSDDDNTHQLMFTWAESFFWYCIGDIRKGRKVARPSTTQKVVQKSMARLWKWQHLFFLTAKAQGCVIGAVPTLQVGKPSKAGLESLSCSSFPFTSL